MKALIILLFFALPLQAQVVFPGVVSTAAAAGGNNVEYQAQTAGDSTDATAYSIAYNPTAGSNRMIYVNVTTWDTPTAVAISSVAQGATNATLVGAYDGTGQDHVETWRFPEADIWSGSQTVVITAASNTQSLSVTILQFQYVNQSDPDDAVQTASAASGQPSDIVTSETGDMVMDHILYYNTTVSAGASQTKRSDSGPDAVVDSDAASTEPGAASVTMSWTGVSGTWAQMSFNINKE